MVVALATRCRAEVSRARTLRATNDWTSSWKHALVAVTAGADQVRQIDWARLADCEASGGGSAKQSASLNPRSPP